MPQEDIGNDKVEQESVPVDESPAFSAIRDRQERRRRRASLGKLVSYIIALILVIILMLWLRRAGM